MNFLRIQQEKAAPATKEEYACQATGRSVINERHGRGKAVRNWSAKVSRGELLVGAAVGAGSAARAAVAGGADFVLALSAGRMRVMGASSVSSCFPIYDAQPFTEDFVQREFVGITEAPVVLGVSMLDARLDFATVFDTADRLGLAGVTKWPSSTVMSDSFKSAMEMAGQGFPEPLSLIQKAKKHGQASVIFIETPEEAHLAVRAGAYLINICVGWNSGARLAMRPGLTCWRWRYASTDAPVRRGQFRKKVIVVTEGGPIIEARDLHAVFAAIRVDQG